MEVATDALERETDKTLTAMEEGFGSVFTTGH
jgi:hypothetical protein